MSNKRDVLTGGPRRIFEARANTQSYRRPNYWVAGVLESTDEFEPIAPFGPAGEGFQDERVRRFVPVKENTQLSLLVAFADRFETVGKLLRRRMSDAAKQL
jgi:hypothetical protein